MNDRDLKEAVARIIAESAKVAVTFDSVQRRYERICNAEHLAVQILALPQLAAPNPTHILNLEHQLACARKARDAFDKITQDQAAQLSALSAGEGAPYADISEVLDDDDLRRADEPLHAGRARRPGLAPSDDARSPNVGSIADTSARALGFENDQDRADYWKKMRGPASVLSAGEGGWRPSIERPSPRRKIVTLYDDGSGATLYYVTDDGQLIDGEDGCTYDHEQVFDGRDWWTYLPTSFALSVELGSEPMTLPDPLPTLKEPK